MPRELNSVLLVEDDLDIQAVALIALEDVGGLTVEACTSGREALERLGTFQPDLVLLDVMMPGMTGPDTLRALRARPEAQHLPVVFMTARVQKHEVDEYLHMGAIGVIPKPFEPMTLANTLRDLLQAAPAHNDADDDADFQNELLALREQFLRELPGRVTQLRAAWQGVQGGTLPLEDFRRQVHSLVGTGRTLQIGEVAERAATLEDHLDGTPDATRVQALLEALVQAVQRDAP